MSESRAKRLIGLDQHPSGVSLSGPIDCRPLPAATGWLYLSREILRDAAALPVRGVRRSRSRVATDYDRGVWRNALAEKRWLGSATLADYVEPDRGRMRVATISGRLVRIDSGEYYRYRNRLLTSVLERWAGDEEDLVELGCGTGFNIFALRLWGRWKRLVGFDVSENALAAAREATRHFGVSGVAFEPLDVGDPNAPNLRHLRGKVVFTYYVLEQLKYELRPVIENLVRAGVKRAVHIEPGTDLLSPWSLRFVANRLYIHRQDYQDRLVTILRALEGERVLRILDLQRLGYAPSPKNDPVMVVWEAR